MKLWSSKITLPAAETLKLSRILGEELLAPSSSLTDVLASLQTYCVWFFVSWWLTTDQKSLVCFKWIAFISLWNFPLK